MSAELQIDFSGGSWRTRHQDPVAGLGGLRTEEKRCSNLEGNHSNNVKADEKENYDDNDNKNYEDDVNYDGSVFSARGI